LSSGFSTRYLTIFLSILIISVHSGGAVRRDCMAAGRCHLLLDPPPLYEGRDRPSAQARCATGISTRKKRCALLSDFELRASNAPQTFPSCPSFTAPQRFAAVCTSPSYSISSSPRALISVPSSSVKTYVVFFRSCSLTSTPWNASGLNRNVVHPFRPCS